MSNLDKYPSAVVDRAFYLQRKIKRDGLEGIGYMDAAFLHMKAEATHTTATAIDEQLQKHGF